MFFVSPRILQTVVGHRGTEGHQRSNEIFSVLQKSDISMKRTLLSVQSLLHLLFDYYRFSVTRAFSPMVLYHTTIYLHFFYEDNLHCLVTDFFFFVNQNKNKQKNCRQKHRQGVLYQNASITLNRTTRIYF